MRALTNRETILAQLGEALRGVDDADVCKLEEQILGAREVFCYGLGRSGLSCRGFAMRLMHMGIACNIVGDTLCHPIGEGDLLLLTSASGGSEALLNAANKARSVGAKVALVTGNKDSALSRMADVSVIIKAPSKEDLGVHRASVLPMGSLFEEASYLLYDMVIADIMEDRGITNDQMRNRHANLE